MILAVRDLVLSYGDAIALDRVSLEVRARSITAIVGGNGAGKTSLIRAIAGMRTPRAGHIYFKGEEITGWPSHKTVARGIGQVAEGRQLFPTLTVLENLEMGAMTRRARSIAKANLEEVYTLFPRLADRRRQPAGTLSGGEQQMVAIGRALMGNPELIMFDEPSLGLAPLAVAELFRVVVRLGATRTVILVEQNVAASLKIAERAFVLDNGRIVLTGSGSDLLAHERVRQAYLGL